MMNDNSITVRSHLWQFQLYLLSIMRVQPLILEAALTYLEATEEDLKNAKNEMTAYGFGRAGTSARLYREMLGEPIAVRSLNNSMIPGVFNGSHALFFRLPLWRDFEFVVNESREGLAWDPGFKRRMADSNTVLLNSCADLKPWTVVKEDITYRFGAPKNGEGWDHWEELYYHIPSTTGGSPRSYLLIFDYNLLQSIESAG
jgi:hypothetical protein